MRWDDLFDDLEAQMHAQERLELEAEVADRTRREWAEITLVDRLAAHVGKEVAIHLMGVGRVRVALADFGKDWVLVSTGGVRGQLPASGLVPLGALTRVDGLGPEARTGAGDLRRRLGIGHALRALARDRVRVEMWLRDGQRLGGTVDRVGGDHMEVTLHPDDTARRTREVRGHALVPMGALAFLRST